MARVTRKALIFHVGPHVLLAEATMIRQVIACNAGFWQQAATASSGWLHWQHTQLPFLPMRACLGLPEATPAFALVLEDQDQQPCVMLGVDRVERTVEIAPQALFPLQGIHAQLDRYFDSLLVEDRSPQRLLLHLRPANAWLAQTLADPPLLEPTHPEHVHD